MEQPANKVDIVQSLTWTAVIVILFFIACSWDTVPTRQYYSINYMPVSNVPAASQRPYPYALQVGRFEVQRIFNRQNIIYRFSPNQIQYYELERWAVRPDYMIKDMVFKHLETSQLTNRVSIEFLDTKPDYRIEGTVEALEKFDAGDLFFAHLAMGFKLFRVSDGTQVWSYLFDQRKRVYSKEMIQTVRMLSSILQAEMNVVVSQLDSLFLTMETGKPLITVDESVPTPSAPADSTGSDIDESAFEIIPEKK